MFTCDKSPESLTGRPRDPLRCGLRDLTRGILPIEGKDR